MKTTHPLQEWIIEKESMLHAMYGLKISIGVYRDHFRVSSWGVGEYELKFETSNGDTVDEAVEGLMAKFPNKRERIAAIRQQAAMLMNEAAQLEREEDV